MNIKTSNNNGSILLKSNIFNKLEHMQNNYNVKNKIYDFNKNYIKELALFIEKYPDNNILIEDYIEDVSKFSDEIDKNLRIKNNSTLDQILATIEISELLLEGGVEEEDIDGILNSFYRLEPDLKELKAI